MDQAEIRRVNKTVEAIYGFNHGRPGTPAISLLGLYGLPRRMASGLPVWNVLKLLPGRRLAEQKGHRTLGGPESFSLTFPLIRSLKANALQLATAITGSAVGFCCYPDWLTLSH